MSRLLFLSHSGIDTEAANGLKQRILSAPAARENGLSVWFDKDDLRTGEPWQRQIEEAVDNSHAFAVYVGSKGVINWVDAEVRLALNRAVTEPDYRFIPILSGSSCGPDALPGFAKQFQGVFEVESRPDQFDKFLQAVLGGAKTGRLELEAEPFFGLRAIEEGRSHLFFGREKEAESLVDRVHRTPLVLLTGDSGSGKSSLVRAGLVPRFRGGALALLDGARPDEAIWHVVTTRPGNQPFRQLGDAVDDAAKALGLPLAYRGALADWAASGEIDKARRGLRCDLPLEQVQVLLVVDQFDELLTVTPPELRSPFIDFLLDLSDPVDRRHRVVLTMRQDYVNLCSPFKRLMDRLDADERRSRFRLGRVTDQGLRRIVIEPLRLAGVDQAEREALATEVLRDVGERPGDLALVQMALTETWQARNQHGGDLLFAYADIGRVEGALAQAAEGVRTRVLDSDEHALLDSILLRLVRLGDTGGATRRIAIRNEFNDARWSLIQRLASKDGKRLVLVGGSTEAPTAEIAHEALVTAWPYFQNLLQETADEKRVLESLIPRAQGWAVQQDPGDREKRLARGADLELFLALSDRKPEWLSHDERSFVTASRSAEDKRRRRERVMIWALEGIAAMLLVAFSIATWMGWRAIEAERIALAERDKASTAETKVAEERDRATETAKIARENESRALAALAENASNQHRYMDAVKLALAAWPRTPDGDRPRLRVTLRALGRAQRRQRLAIPPLRHDGRVDGAIFNGDETRILTRSLDDGTARLWDTATGEAVLPSLRHEHWVEGATFNSDETRILTWSWDGTARLWDAATGQAVLPPLRHEGSVVGAVFNDDETRILTWSRDDGAVRLWDGATGEAVLPPLRHESLINGAVVNSDRTRIFSWSYDRALLWNTATGEVLQRYEERILGAIFNGDETRILTWSLDHTARLWDAATGDAMLPPLRHEAGVHGAVFNTDETRVLTWSGGRYGDNTARLWDTATGDAMLPPLRHEHWVKGATFNGDGTRILTWSWDGTVRLWDAATGAAALPPLRHEGAVNGVVFNNDGSRLLTWSENTARLWDATTGEAGLAPLHHEGELKGAAFNDDGTRILTWSLDGTARLWDATTGKAVLAPLRHEAGLIGAVFNGDETRILSWSWDNTARLWEVAAGEAGPTPLHHESWVEGAVFNADKTRVLTWSRDHTARLWDAATGEPVLPPLRHEDAVWGALFSADETRVLTWSLDGTARLWDAATGEAVLLPLRHEDAVSGAVFNGNGTRILTWSGGLYGDETARLWDALTGEVLLRYDGGLYGAVFNGDGTRILSWFRDGMALLWDSATGEAVVPPLRHEDAVWGALFSADETHILTWSSDHTARLWDAATGDAMLPPLRHNGAVRRAVFNGDGTRILTWSDDNTARVWDTATGRTVLTLRHEGGLNGDVSGAIFNSDETRILTWSDNDAARVWDTATGQTVLTLRHEGVLNGDVRGAAFNRDETRILTWSSDHTVRLWDAVTGRVLVELRHGSGVDGAVLNRNGTRILTWSRDNTARLWDVTTGEALLMPLRHEGAVEDAVFNSGETRILTWSSEDDTAFLWDVSRLPSGHLIDVACGMLPDPDTRELEKRYGITITEPICGPETPAPVWTTLEN